MKLLNILAVSVVMMSATATLSWGHDQDNHSNAQRAKLYELQAAFHRSGSVHDPVNGDSATVINLRIRYMLSLWTKKGVLTFQTGGPRDGNYIGQGDPEDALTCPTPSADPENRGTLCTFFKYVAGSFQPANKLVSLAPSYSTSFHVHEDSAAVYFECHFFNVSADPLTGTPVWTAAAHLGFDGSAHESTDRWRFSKGKIFLVGVPIP